MVEELDRAVGRLLAAIDEAGIGEDAEMPAHRVGMEPDAASKLVGVETRGGALQFLDDAGTPLVGDPIYGKPSRNAVLPDRLMLHAWKLSFEHPLTRKRLSFEAPIPQEFEAWTQNAGL